MTMNVRMTQLTAKVEVTRRAGTAGRAPLPTVATAGAAGLDLTAFIDEPLVLAPGERRLVPTGISIALPGPHLVGLVFARSGLASRVGIQLANGVGVIDSDYRGEIQVALQHAGSEPYVVNPGDRIAQLVIVPVVAVAWNEVEELSRSERGEGGFGSTGVGR